MQAQFTLNQSRAEEITMREDYGCQLPSLQHDEEGFGDIGFGDSESLELIRDGSNVDHSLEPVCLLLPFQLETDVLIFIINILFNLSGKLLW